MRKLKLRLLFCPYLHSWQVAEVFFEHRANSEPHMELYHTQIAKFYRPNILQWLSSNGFLLENKTKQNKTSFSENILPMRTKNQMK